MLPVTTTPTPTPFFADYVPAPSMMRTDDNDDDNADEEEEAARPRNVPAPSNEDVDSVAAALEIPELVRERSQFVADEREREKERSLDPFVLNFSTVPFFLFRTRQPGAFFFLSPLSLFFTHLFLSLFSPPPLLLLPPNRHATRPRSRRGSPRPSTHAWPSRRRGGRGLSRLPPAPRPLPRPARKRKEKRAEERKRKEAEEGRAGSRGRKAPPRPRSAPALPPPLPSRPPRRGQGRGKRRKRKRPRRESEGRKNNNNDDNDNNNSRLPLLLPPAPAGRACEEPPLLLQTLPDLPAPPRPPTPALGTTSPPSTARPRRRSPWELTRNASPLTCDLPRWLSLTPSNF